MKFLVVRSEYSRCLLELGRFEETLTELSTIVEQARQVYGDDDEETFKAWNNYAWGLYKAGMISEAQFEYECLLDATVQKIGADASHYLRHSRNIIRYSYTAWVRRR